MVLFARSLAGAASGEYGKCTRLGGTKASHDAVGHAATAAQAPVRCASVCRGHRRLARYRGGRCVWCRERLGRGVSVALEGSCSHGTPEFHVAAFWACEQSKQGVRGEAIVVCVLTGQRGSRGRRGRLGGSRVEVRLVLCRKDRQTRAKPSSEIRSNSMASRGSHIFVFSRPWAVGRRQ